MMSSIAGADGLMDINLAGGFLNDIHYDTQSGISASPYYWSTFSGTNTSDWTMNMGLTTVLNDGSWFGCSYTDVDSLWNPINLPENPDAAPITNKLNELDEFNLEIYPNPCVDQINITGDLSDVRKVSLSDLTGKVVHSSSVELNYIMVSLLPASTYQLQIFTDKHIYSRSIVKQ
jgi:hypothetical protein